MQDVMNWLLRMPEWLRALWYLWAMAFVVLFFGTSLIQTRRSTARLHGDLSEANRLSVQALENSVTLIDTHAQVLRRLEDVSQELEALRSTKSGAGTR